MNQPEQYLPMRDPEAFNRREGVCYRDEQGNEYNYGDFLAICNADEAIAARLFSLVYWASPALHFFLDEELPIARQTHHNDVATRWLQFKETPSQEQTQALRQSGWLALDAEQHVWEGEQALPSGIAFRNYGARNYSPLEEKAREEQGREVARAHTAQTLTSAAKARHDQFLRDYEQSMELFVQGPTYLIRQLPAKPEVVLSQAETDANLHTHAGYATDLEALYQELQRREPHGIILLMEFREGKIVSQVKATCDRGNLIHLRSREPDSDLFPALLTQAERINAISVRERLIQRWETEEETRTKNRDFEIFTIEWLPLSRKIHREDAQANREPYQAGAAETILRLMGVSSAYAFGLQIAEFLSDIPGYVPLPDAQAFLAELEEQYNAASTALSQAAPEGLAHIIEHGRKMGFSLLMHEARKFLLPLRLQDSEENARSNHQREQGEKLQPPCKWMPLKVHDNTVDIAIQRLQATVDQYQQYLPALDELLAMTQHREFGSLEATAYLHKFVQWQVGLEHEEIAGKILAARWEIIQLSARDEKSQWPHYKVEYGFKSDHFADAQFTYIPVKMAEHFRGVEEAFQALGLLQNGDGEKAIIIGDIDTTSLYTPDGEEYIVPTHDFEWASFFTGGKALAGDSNGNFDGIDSEIVQVPDDLLDRIEASGVKDWEVAAKIAFEQWFWISRIHLVSQNTGGDSSEECGNGVTQPELEQQQSKLRTWTEKHAQECEACFIVQQREKNIAKS